MQLTYFPNVIFPEYRFAIALATGFALLGEFVFAIVKLGAKKKVGRIYARRIVAFMETIKPFGNGAVMQFVRNAVSETVIEQSIPASVFSGLPFPTLIWTAFVNLLPKAVFAGTPRTHFRPVSNNEAGWLAFCIAALGVCLRGKRRGQTTATFAEFDSIRGMIGVHGKLPFLSLIRERCRDAARYFFACATGAIVAQKGCFGI